MRKLTLLAAVLGAILSAPAFAAGTLPGISMTQQLDEFAKPLSGGKLSFIQAGTTSTPQNCYQDTALTLAWPNPLTLDAAGRVPQVFCADGIIKIRLTDKNGNQKLVQDNLLVVGPSGGGGGGGTIDPTTIAATGDLKVAYGTSVLSGWVRANGRTIGSSTSGATERANADCQALFVYLWGADANLVVSGGRGASAAADWAANKTIALPDWAGRALAGLDDMGAGAKGRLTSTYFGTSATVLGAAGGTESRTLTAAQLPANIPNSATTTSNSTKASTGSNSVVAPGSQSALVDSGPLSLSTTVTINPSGGQAHATVSPMMLATIYLKL